MHRFEVDWDEYVDGKHLKIMLEKYADRLVGVFIHWSRWLRYRTVQKATSIPWWFFLNTKVLNHKTQGKWLLIDEDQLLGLIKQRQMAGSQATRYEGEDRKQLNRRCMVCE